MTTVNVHEAKTNLSRLIRAACDGEEITIARSGTPLVRLVPIDAASLPHRIGFMPELAGRVPDDFDVIDSEQIADLFEGAGQ